MEIKKNYKGLSSKEVLENRIKYGENILTEPIRQSLLSKFLEKFKDPIIKILLAALLASISVSVYQYVNKLHGISVLLEPAGILFAILLATVVGFAFEVSANKKFDILNQVNDDTFVKVIRNGNICEITRKEVVVGDFIVFEAGEEVAADGILIEAVSLHINESTLTGEPLIKKTTNEVDFDKQATYPSNEVMKGTNVVDGHGIMQVTAIGNNTEYGKVYQGSQIDNKIETPLNKQLKSLSDVITYFSYGIASTIILFRLSLYFINNDQVNFIEAGSYILNTVMIAVTIIVVSVPEGLPMSVMLSLALSMKRMLNNNNLVRKMHACETMGAATVICTDKTGTLTYNQMNVYQTNSFGFDANKPFDNQSGKMFAEAISVNSTAFLDYSTADKIKALGNPTEGALLLWLHKKSINYLDIRENLEIIDQLTFSTERKYMATLIFSPILNKKVLYVKGAPEIVLSLCSNIFDENKVKQPITDKKSEIEKQLLEYQNKAMRTLGFAYKIIEDDNLVCFKEGKLNVSDLIFTAIVAISDPIREDVPESIKECLKAGINVKIVTGDTPATAKEIGRQIGLWLPSDGDEAHLTGVEFAAMSNEQLLNRILSLKILSRARPMDKERLVKLLQQKDQVVAVTGDGTNDAPALNAAQIGLSMGDGTSVAKEASAITIMDNSFKSITKAVMWGRSLYQNIQRFIVFQITINVAACLIVLIGSLLGGESPLTVTQMLWVNLIMDTFAALALASLPPNEKVMLEKPRKTTDHIITKKMTVNILGTGLFFVVLLFGIVQYFKHVDIVSLTDFSITDFCANFFNFSNDKSYLSPYELSMFFTIFVMLQFWNMFNAKAFNTGKSAFSDFSKSVMEFFSVALLIVFGQYFIITFGGSMFNVVPLKTKDWIIIIISTSLVLWVGELARFIKNKNYI